MFVRRRWKQAEKTLRKAINLCMRGYGVNLQGGIAPWVATKRGLDVGRGVWEGAMLNVEGRALPLTEDGVVNRLGAVGADKGC